MTAPDLARNVDLMTGQARYDLALLAHPGRGGLGLSLDAAYDSATLGTATRWNLDAPTGVMGLGWSLGLQSIQMLRGGGSVASGDRTYLLRMVGLSSPLVCIGMAADGSSTWVAVNYAFWKITYDPAQELWTIVDTDGLVRLFGGTGSGRGTVDMAVRWQDWSSINGTDAGADSLAVGWSLSEIVNLVGDRITYSYTQTPVAVLPSAALYFTRETMLTGIIGADGSRIALTYADKAANEYQNPCTDPMPPNGGQDRYPTQYLANAALYAANGTLLEKVLFNYADAPLGSGSLTKRLLSAVTWQTGAGIATAPPTSFTYWGQNAGDEVSATSVQSGNALYGALKSVTLPVGGAIAFSYQSVPLTYAARSLALGSPTQPMVSVNDSQVLVTSLSGGNAVLSAYIWSGRWLANHVMTAPLPAGLSYDAVQVAAGPDCCALLAGTLLTISHRDPSQPGGWFISQAFTLALATGESATLAAGRGFVAVLGLNSGQLFTFRFTGDDIGTDSFQGGWDDDAAITLGSAGDRFALAADGALLLVLALPAAGGATGASLYQHLADGSWQAATRSVDLGLAASTGLDLWMGSGFAVARATGVAAGGSNAGYGALWWSADATILSGQGWTSLFAATGTDAATPVIAGATVSIANMLYRFTGSGWNSFNGSSIAYANVSGLPVLSIGSDLVARWFTTTSGSAITDLLAYDPLAGTWTVPGQRLADGTLSADGMSFAGVGLAAVAPLTDGGLANYAIVGNALWYRGPDQTWSSLMNLPDTITTGSQVRLVGNRYLVMQQGTGTASVATLVYYLVNGGVASTTPTTLAGAQIILPDGTDGTLVGPYGFAAYTGTWGDAASAITLYQPAANAVTGAQTGYAIATVTATNGYQTQSNINGSFQAAFSYQAGTIDPTGMVPLFNKVTMAAGVANTSDATAIYGTQITAFYNGLTSGETPAVTYPLAADVGTATLAVTGIAYQTQSTKAVTDSLGVVSQSMVSQSVQAYDVTQLQLGGAGTGYYARLTTLSGTLDGVGSTSTAIYCDQTGFPISRSLQVYNAAGTIDTWTTLYTYLWQAYDVPADLNLLSPVVQQVVQSTPAGAAASTIAINVQTWRQWSGDVPYWAPDRQYRGLKADASFTAWTAGTEPAATDFMLVGQVTARTAHGLPVVAEDSLGTSAAVLYDLSQTYPVATAGNAGSADIHWYGCEPYESTGGWTSSAAGMSIQDYLTTADYHTGTQCLMLPASSSAGPMLSLVPADQDRCYVFSCWARTLSSYVPSAGHVAQWTITPYDPATGDTEGTPITLVMTPYPAAVPTAVGQWAYFQVTINLPQLLEDSGLKALGLSFLASNANSTGVCYIDELRLAPLDCRFGAMVYDPDSFRITATIDGNGQPAITIYDQFNAPSIRVGPDGRVDQAAQSGFALWSANPNGSFNPYLPNATVALASPAGSSFLDFHNDDSPDWSFAGGAWSFGGGELNCVPTVTTGIGATATYTKRPGANLAAMVTIASRPASGVALALGNGAFYLRWTSSSADAATGAWTLVQLVTATDGSGATSTSVTTLATNQTTAYQSNWLFAIIDGMIICYAGGAPIFYYEAGTGISGSACITLAATGDASFDNLAVLQDPLLSWTGQDGLGQAFLSLAVLGYQPDADNVLYPGDWVLSAAPTLVDTLGRPQYCGQAMLAPAWQYALATGTVTTTNSVAGSYNLLAMNQSTYLVSDDGDALSVSDYEKGTEGYTYGRITYEASPLSRVIMQDAPRGAYVSGTEYCTELTQYGGSATVGHAPGADTGTLKYSVVSRQALLQETAAASLTATPVTLINQTTVDTLGRVLMVQSGPAAGPMLTTGYAYDAARRLSTLYLPNYYAPPDGSSAAAWTESYRYDFLGRLILRTTPDAGTTQWAYDDLGRVRFTLDANGAALTPQRILYIKYDALGRVLETGYIQDATYSWGDAALTGMVNVASFPAIGADAKDDNAATGAISTITTYDSDMGEDEASSDTRFLIGRIGTVSIAPTDGASGFDTESYSYDAFGNALTKNVIMPGLSPSAGWTLTYTYDALDRVTSIAYPDMTATAGTAGTATTLPKAGYDYDRLGRMAAVGGAPTGAVIDPDNPPLDQDATYAAYAYNIFGSLAWAQYNNAGGAAGAPIPREFTYDSYQRLTGIADSYLQQALTYPTGGDVTGWTYFNQMIACADTAYDCGATVWTDPLCCVRQTVTYDGYGRLSQSDSSLGNAFDLAMAPVYDSNGNIQGFTRGASTGTYDYVAADGTYSDRVRSVTYDTAAAVDFSTAPVDSDGWSWGSDNDGPSASAVTADTPVDDGTNALMLAGGSVGHYELLQLATFAVSGTTYTLAWSAATGDGYPAAATAGGAAWFVVLNAATGPVCTIRVATLTASPTAWLAGSYNLDLTSAGIQALTGVTLELVSVSIELRNLCAGADGSAGAAIYVQSASFQMAGAGTLVATYGYDGNGNVTAATARGLSSLDYDAVSNLTRTISLSAGGALTLAYGGNGRRSRATLTPAAGSGLPTLRTITLTGLDGALLATQTRSDTTVTNVAVYIQGVDGPIAVTDGSGSAQYLLTDHLGTPQVTVKGADGTVPSGFNLMPFGNAQQATGQPATPLGFTGQWLDAASGLYNFNARLYDPGLGRFYAVDPIATPTSPYSYVGNDPVNLVDPSGAKGKKRKPGEDDDEEAKDGGGGKRKTARQLEVKAASVAATNALIASGFPLEPVTFHIGQYHQSSTERRRLRVTGSQYQAEHVVGHAVLVQGTDLRRTGSGWSGRIENLAPAYQEVFAFHRAHIGTGTGGDQTATTGFTSDTYRDDTRLLLETGLVGAAIQLNQLGYAWMRGYRRTGGVGTMPTMTLADTSFENMMMNMRRITYAEQTPAGPRIRRQEIDDVTRLEALLSRMIVRAGRWLTWDEMADYTLRRFGVPLLAILMTARKPNW